MDYIDPHNCTPEALFTLDTLRRAWRMVRKNGQSPGTDKVTPSQFERRLDDELRTLRGECIEGSYRPRPVQRFYQVKPSGKKRPLTIWAVRDRVAQRVLLDYLTPRFEEVFLDCSYGFRPRKRVEDAIEAVNTSIRADLRWVVDADISECFDSIPIDLMQAQVRSFVPEKWVAGLIDHWLKTPIAGQAGKPVGVSQGGVISPLLTNLYLHRFDQIITAALPGAHLVRFADDFVILCHRKPEALSALTTSQQALRVLKMRVNEAKTRVVHVDEGFSFLGVSFRGGQHPLMSNPTGRKEGDPHVRRIRA